MSIIGLFKDVWEYNFTIINCVKHPTIKFSPSDGCRECYRELVIEARRLDREDRIEEMTEAIVRASKLIEVKEERK